MWPHTTEVSNESPAPKKSIDDASPEQVIELAEGFIEVMRRISSAIGRSQMTEASRADDLAFIDGWIDGFNSEVEAAREETE